MFAITGITGKVGGEGGAHNLLAANQPVRAVVRDLSKGEAWVQLGCELVRADINDAGALTSAFEQAESVFVARSAELRSVARLSRRRGRRPPR